MNDTTNATAQPTATVRPSTLRHHAALHALAGLHAEQLALEDEMLDVHYDVEEAFQGARAVGLVDERDPYAVSDALIDAFAADPRYSRNITAQRIVLDAAKTHALALPAFQLVGVGSYRLNAGHDGRRTRRVFQTGTLLNAQVRP